MVDKSTSERDACERSCPSAQDHWQGNNYDKYHLVELDFTLVPTFHAGTHNPVAPAANPPIRFPLHSRINAHSPKGTAP